MEIILITASRPALRPTQPPNQWAPGGLSLGVMRPGRETDHSPPSSAEVKNAWSYTSTPPICLHGVVISQSTGTTLHASAHEGVTKSFRTELITKYTLTTINTRWEATQRVMVAKLTRLTHKIAIQLNLVAENCTICSSRFRRPVRKLLDTPSYTQFSLIFILYSYLFTLFVLDSINNTWCSH
jgi:hypothetical protein